MKNIKLPLSIKFRLWRNKITYAVGFRIGSMWGQLQTFWRYMAFGQDRMNEGVEALETRHQEKRAKVHANPTNGMEVVYARLHDLGLHYRRDFEAWKTWQLIKGLQKGETNPEGLEVLIKLLTTNDVQVYYNLLLEHQDLTEAQLDFYGEYKPTNPDLWEYVIGMDRNGNTTFIPPTRKE